MPSSLLFAGLVGTWLAVLVPMAARRRQPMTRPSDAAMASRVLARPARERGARDRPGTEEVTGTMHGLTDHVEPRYRPGRGGYDPEAAELAARARCAFRQRVVLALVLLAGAGALVAAGLSLPEAWWVHGGTDLVLVVYLANLRRQVRSEQAIRARRAARLVGARAGRRTASSGTAGNPVAPGRGDYLGWGSEPHDASEPDSGPSVHLDGHGAEDRDFEPVDPVDPVDVAALPLLRTQPLPEPPVGTETLELDDEDPGLHDLDEFDHRRHWGYRRAAG